MNKTSKLIAIYATFLGFFVLYWVIYAVSSEFHARFLQGEDRLIEWITFASFLSASMLAGAITIRQRRSLTQLALAYFAFLALFFFVCAGEEISWGQRLFGFRTPEAIASLNEQGEFNIHNLEMEHFHPKDIVSWFMKLWGMILPLVLLKWTLRPDGFLRRYMPAPSLVPCFAFGELINLFEEPFKKLLHSTLGAEAYAVADLQTEELLEMYWALSALVAMLFIWKAWRREE